MRHPCAKTLVAVAFLLGLLMVGLFAAAAPATADNEPLREADAPAPRQLLDQTSVFTHDIHLETDPDAAGAITRLESGELDIYAGPIADPDLAAQIEASPDLEGYRSYGGFNELTFNTVGPEFDDGRLNPFHVPRIREAMNYLIDRAYIVDEIKGGMAEPCYTPINFASRDRALLADLIAAKQLQYAYDKERAAEIITEEMGDLGAEKVGGAWTYEGAPVELIGLIRVEDDRTEIGHYVADQLEDLGFTVQRDVKTSAEAANCWINTDPGEGCFSFYTGGWVSPVISRDEGNSFLFFYTPDGFPGFPLWQNYTPTAEFYQLARDLAYHDFSTMDERRDMMAQALDLALKDSAHVFLVSEAGITPRRAEVSYASDLSGGILGSSIWAQTLQREPSATTPLSIALPSLFQEAWNPIAGSDGAYDGMVIRATQSGAVVADPLTGLMLPMRVAQAEVFVEEGLPVVQNLDWATLHFVDQITVPDDAWVDWDAEKQVFITAGESYVVTPSVKSKVVIHYETDLFSEMTWHDGSPYTLADFVMFMIMTFDRAKPASPIYDESYVTDFDGFMSTFRGWRIVNEDPLVVEYYADDYQLDAENNVGDLAAASSAAYRTGEAPWHTVALGWHVEAGAAAAFSSAKARALGVPHMDYISGTLGILKSQLDAASVDSFVPYSPTLGQYVTETQITQRLTNLDQWYDDRGHFWVGSGPVYLAQVYTDTGELTLKPYVDHPDPGDKWDSYTTAPIADVSVDGPESFERGATAVYTVEVTLNGEPYPAEDIVAVRYLVLDSQNTVRASGQATETLPTGMSSPIRRAAVSAEGLWYVVLDADVTRQIPPGPTRLQIAVSSKRVVIPSFDDQTFTAPDAEIYLPLALRTS